MLITVTTVNKNPIFSFRASQNSDLLASSCLSLFAILGAGEASVAGGESVHHLMAAPPLPPPRPKSPPQYPDLYGKRREMAKVQMLEREISFLEEELKSIQRLQPASRCCKEVADFVMANSDPLIPTNKSKKPCRFWKWLCGIPCFKLSWICCCSCPQCSCHLKCPNCNHCNSCFCNPCDGGLPNCISCLNCHIPKWKCSCSCFSCPRSSCCFHISCCRNWCKCRFPWCADFSCCRCKCECFCPKCPRVKPRCCSCTRTCCNPSCCLF